MSEWREKEGIEWSGRKMEKKEMKGESEEKRGKMRDEVHKGAKDDNRVGESGE